jgi:peroxiredoxin
VTSASPSFDDYRLTPKIAEDWQIEYNLLSDEEKQFFKDIALGYMKEELGEMAA